jgi:hypothetical protein
MHRYFGFSKCRKTAAAAAAGVFVKQDSNFSAEKKV